MDIYVYGEFFMSYGNTCMGMDMAAITWPWLERGNHVSVYISLSVHVLWLYVYVYMLYVYGYAFMGIF